MASWQNVILLCLGLLLRCPLIFATPVSKSYDFIVVGGGTAGLALATRLSQSLRDCTVLVIEAGPDGRDVPGIYIPKLAGSELGSIYDWNFTTVPQPEAGGRMLSQNRGHVLGGSSALNLLSYDRAAKADYDAWEQLGNPGWNWASMHAAMQKSETFQRTAEQGEAGIAATGGVGYNGPVHFLVNRYDPAQQQAFWPAMQNLGVDQTYSFLDGDMLGWMRHTSNILNTNYTRNYSPTFLPYAGSNLVLKVNTMVAKVNIDESGRATGVTLKDNTVITACKEVILSAGSIQSPQLLELSGIGNKTILSAAGIKPLVHLPGVGENLQDHLRITTAYQLKPNYTSPDELKVNTTFASQQMALYQKNKTSIYDETSSGYTYLTWPMAGLDQSDFVSLAKQSQDGSMVDKVKLHHLKNLNKRVPQLEVLFDDGYLGNKGYPNASSPLYGANFFTMIASINHMYSRGSSHINSSNAMAHPVLDPLYLSRPYDVEAITQGAKYLRTIASTPPLRDTWVDEYEPGLDAVKTDAEWEAYARDNCLTIWHPMGTCAMLPRKDGGVVSPELKVYGVKGLRVADASIMPILISGHIQTGVYGIAERAAEMIIAEYS